MALFEEFRRAWRQAVDNFWHEMEGDDAAATSRAVYREVAAVRNQLDELEDALGATRQRLAHEEDQVDACRRRERLARTIGDDETARVASEYRDRHLERAAVLRRKLDALDAERRLCERDLREMERALREQRITGADDILDELDLDRHPHEHEFLNLENTERSRSAEERLEELKRRMGE